MERILCLHGALGGKSQFDLLKLDLENDYSISSINFPGHEGEGRGKEAFTIENLGIYVLGWMEKNCIESIHIFGYSMGGYVALWLARYYPTKVKSIMTLGTKLAWDEEQAIKEVRMLDPEKIEAKVPLYAQLLKRRHGEDQWESVLKDTSNLMIQLGVSSLSDSDYAHVECDTLLCRGENDNMASREETMQVAKCLPKGVVHTYAAAGHTFEDIEVKELTERINIFLKSRSKSKTVK